MITTPTTVEELLDYWPGNIPFKGNLISQDGSCMCAQGQALHFLGGLSVKELQVVSQCEADRRVAKLFSISIAHSVLLRIVNDGQEGAPSSVIRHPEQVLGDQAQSVLAFWRHLDRITPTNSKIAHVAWTAAKAAAGAAAGTAANAAWAAARTAAMYVVWHAAWDAAEAAVWTAAAAAATNEIQGAAVMRARNQPFFFLPLFGYADPEAVMLLDAAKGGMQHEH